MTKIKLSKTYNESHKAFELAVKGENSKHYSLRLYVTGATPQSIKAVTNIKKICEEYLKNRHTLEIIDIYQQPKFAEVDQIIAAPTLVKRLPFPLKRLVGDMSDKKRVLHGLDLKPIKKYDE